MTKEAKIILSVALLCIGLVVWRYKVQTTSQPVTAEEATSAEEPIAPLDAADTAREKKPVDAPLARPKAPPQNKAALQSLEKSFSFNVPKNVSQEEQEIASLGRYSKALYLFSSSEQRPEFLVKKLSDAGLKPLVVQDFNEFTGKMIVVRTDETLPGTRYFHAQYFEDENKQPFLQHMSFEFRPNEKSLDEAVTEIKKAFPPSLGEPQYCIKNYAAWEHGDYTVHCKRLTKEDIENDDPNRARSEEDINAVKCSVEQNPHPHEELCG